MKMKNNKQKILHIITLSNWGGAQRICFDLVTNLDKEKFQVEVAVRPGGILVDKLKEKGIPVHQVDSLKREISPLNDLKALFSLYRLIRKGKYDIVHCHSTKAGILGRIAAKLAGVKKIYFTAHGWGFYNQEEYGWAQKLIIFLEKISAKCSTKIICVSEQGKKDGVKRKIAKENKFLVTKNGICWKEKITKEEAKKKMNAKTNEIVTGMVGRLAYQKDPLMFLEVGKEIIKKFPKTKFILIGDGPLMKECKDFVKENELEKTVFLLGEKPPGETRELLTGLDIFVLTSKFEGLPLTVVEAMFAGLPIIATNVGGISEVVKNEVGGFLINPPSREKLIEKISYLIKNPLERRKMGQKNRKFAKENLTLEKMVEEYENLYSQC